jgi:hypothetical protein
MNRFSLLISGWLVPGRPSTRDPSHDERDGFRSE